MAIAVVIVLLVVGSVVFHFASPWWFTEIASHWTSVDFTIELTFWVTGLVFVLVNLFLAYSVYRYRQRKGEPSKAVYEPENARLETGLTVLTTLGVAAMLAPGLFVWAQFVSVPEDATEFEAFGSQWQWAFRYPGDDGVMGTADISHITETNPWGINPDDPNGQDDRVVKKPYMMLQVDQPVKALLRSRDVLHNYTVPQFRIKMDMVPGMVSYLWLTPTRTGVFDILCEQYCGLGHHIMRARVEVAEPAQYASWLQEQPTFAETQTREDADISAGQQAYAVCASCHGQQGEGNQAMNAPKLAGLQPWYINRQLRYYQEGVRGAHEDDEFGRMMAPMANMVASPEARANVSAYIASLPVSPAATTQNEGDPARGMRIYSANCASCHGDDGMGSWATDAPALAGMDDWYLATQLQNYRDGIRGAHREDDYGYQMTSMVKAMRTQEQQNDVISYINTLR
ncbi:c-type cytochrome [Pseudohongiella acticola]|jgi:cytochrome c oxidase subunit II|uniref:c-type cytochrome n=1 Tax=Pseudohongiella acticola TaxID=1524254 RepID=UPI0030EDE5C7